MKKHHPLDRLPYYAIIVSIAAVALAACGTSAKDETTDIDTTARTKRVVRVETETLRPTDFEEVLDITGTVEATSDAVLSAQTSGTVVWLAPLGARRGAGQVVARLEATVSRAALDQARAQRNAAQAQFDLADDTYLRQQPLFSDSIISALEFENIRAARAQALAQLSQAEAVVAQVDEQLSYTVIKAPFAGAVEEHFVDEGEQIGIGMPVARVVNGRKVKISAGIPERFTRDIHIGTPVTASFRPYGLANVKGTVSYVSSVINTANRTFTIEVEIDNNDGQLKPAMIANVFVTRRQLDDVIVVPQDVIIRDEIGQSVYVVQTENDRPVAVRRPVTVGPSYRGRAVVESGLHAGDQLIVAGQSNVTPGDALEIINRTVMPAAGAKEADTTALATVVQP